MSGQPGVDLKVQERQLKNLKLFLDPWRVAIVYLKPIIVWEKAWHPLAIVSVVSIFFFAALVLSHIHNVMTTVIIFLMILSSIDFLAHILTKVLSESYTWTGREEKLYEDCCLYLLQLFIAIKSNCYQLFLLRGENSITFYVSTTSVLFILAWLTVNVNPICLLYVTSLALLLWPGLKQRGICALYRRKSS